MKIRLEGTKKEINKMVEWLSLAKKSDEWAYIGSVSKFYPNRADSTALLNGTIDASNPEGRVYVEMRP